MFTTEITETQMFLFIKKRHCECYLNIPEPQLGAIVRSTGDQVGVIRTPGQVGDSVCVTLQSSKQLQLVALLHKVRKNKIASINITQLLRHGHEFTFFNNSRDNFFLSLFNTEIFRL